MRTIKSTYVLENVCAEKWVTLSVKVPVIILTCTGKESKSSTRFKLDKYIRVGTEGKANAEI